MPFEFLQTNFSNQAYAKNKKINYTHFSLYSSSILNLMYLCNFESSISEIAAYNNPLCLLSNATSLIKFRFSKKESCTISQDHLIIYLFRRVNLYEVPCVTILTFESKNYTHETRVHYISITSYEIST